MFNALKVFPWWCMSLENNVNSVLKILLVQRNWRPLSMQHLCAIVSYSRLLEFQKDTSS